MQQSIYDRSFAYLQQTYNILFVATIILPGVRSPSLLYRATFKQIYKHNSYQLVNRIWYAVTGFGALNWLSSMTLFLLFHSLIGFICLQASNQQHQQHHHHHHHYPNQHNHHHHSSGYDLPLFPEDLSSAIDDTSWNKTSIPRFVWTAVRNVSDNKPAHTGKKCKQIFFM